MEELTSIEARILALESRFPKPSASADMSDLELEAIRLQDETAKLAAIVTVFSAIAAEAYIYDYAARRLSDKFTELHLDKLDTISKWAIVPQLITGNPLPRNGKWMTLLRTVIKERNSIVHSKSRAIPHGLENQRKFFKKITQEHTLILQKARQAIELLDLLAAEISKLDPEEAHWAQIHLK